MTSRCPFLESNRSPLAHSNAHQRRSRGVWRYHHGFMTVALAWVGKRKDGLEHLYIASDSRVMGVRMDACPKILHRLAVSSLRGRTAFLLSLVPMGALLVCLTVFERLRNRATMSAKA